MEIASVSTDKRDRKNKEGGLADVLYFSNQKLDIPEVLFGIYRTIFPRNSQGHHRTSDRPTKSSMTTTKMQLFYVDLDDFLYKQSCIFWSIVENSLLNNSQNRSPHLTENRPSIETTAFFYAASLLKCKMRANPNPSTWSR